MKIRVLVMPAIAAAMCFLAIITSSSWLAYFALGLMFVTLIYTLYVGIKEKQALMLFFAIFYALTVIGAIGKCIVPFMSPAYYTFGTFFKIGIVPFVIIYLVLFGGLMRGGKISVPAVRQDYFKIDEYDKAVSELYSAKLNGDPNWINRASANMMQKAGVDGRVARQWMVAQNQSESAKAMAEAEVLKSFNK